MGKKRCRNFGSLLHCWIPNTVVPEFIVASTIRRHKIRVGNWEIKSSSIFFNLLRGYEKGIFSKSDVGMSITILFLQTPQSDDKSSSFERKIPSLSLNLSQILNSAAPQTNTTWWKLSVSAFQRYWGRGVSDRVYIGKSTYAYLKKFVVVVAEILAGIVETAGGSCGSQAWMLSVVCRILAVRFVETFLGRASPFWWTLD